MTGGLIEDQSNQIEDPCALCAAPAAETQAGENTWTRDGGKEAAG